MGPFEIVFSKKAGQDFHRLYSIEQAEITSALHELEKNPFPFKKKIKKIKGMKKSLYRLRIDLKTQTYRIFYSILENNQILLLRIVPKKEADRALRSLH